MSEIKDVLDINESHWVQQYLPDFDELSQLINTAKGAERTMSQFAEECGVSPATFSRIVNKKNAKATSLTLLQSIAEHASVESNITLEQLLQANGWRKSENEIENNSRIYNISESVKASVLECNQLIRMILSDDLLMRGVGVKILPQSKRRQILTRTGIVLNYDICYETDLFEGCDTWLIKVINQKMTGEILNDDKKNREINQKATDIIKELALLFLFDQWQPKLFTKKKNTLVFVDEEIYWSVKKKLKGMETKNYFTLMLIDLCNCEILDETPLASAGDYEDNSLI
ncbi:hypothetical protein BN3660_03349 [Eubacteriaceae bacterium CHKCI004]|nr:hypothetical protein BN3660_03349 [Eubacteriaceae bacterium CHKCI004]